MGFYGNITNTARTQFQFDRTYSSRYEMDMNSLDDEVYAGRYVLVEYDTVGHDGYRRVWIINGNFYTQNTENITSLLKKDNTPKGTIVYTSTASDDRDNVYDYQGCQFYVCTSDQIAGSNQPAEFKEISNGDNDPPYTVNYTIDSEHYGKGRGYDSTVWQKVYTEGTEKYIMIAELNTVVPRFDVVADAPTMNPLVPHFDTSSTDVYYKLHWQAPWGFRVKEATTNDSDENTVHSTYIYYPNTNTHELQENEVKAAIFYNKPAFNAQVKRDDERVDGETIIKHSTEVTEDAINLSMAQSGNGYSKHDGSLDLEPQDDIQELTIHLPSIGNMVSDAWDIIHGPNRNNARTDENGSLQGRLDSFKEIKGNQIPVKRASDGTLVGSKINDALPYDEWDDKPSEILEDNGVTPGFARDDAWIETVIDTSALVGGVQNGDSIDQSSNSGISIHHTFHSTDNSVSTVDKNTGEMSESETYKSEYIRSTNKDHNTDDVIDLYVPYVDAKGHVVGHNIETVTLPYSYRFFETNAVSTKVTDLYTDVEDNVDEIVGNNKSTVTASSSNLTADRTQDTFTINPGNKWIQTKLSDENDELIIAHEVHAVDEIAQFSNLNDNNADAELDNDEITVQDLIFDTAGHVVQNRQHTYRLPFGYKIITTNGRDNDEISKNQDEVEETQTVASNTQDSVALNSGNYWTRVDIVDDEITLSHSVRDIDIESNGTENLNKEDGAKDEDNINIPDWTYDAAGHIRSKKDHYYTLPFGFKTIKTNGRSNNVEENATGIPTTTDIVADTTQDELIINSGNKWIRIDTDTSADSITIRHDIHKTSSDSHTTDWTQEENNTTIPTVVYTYDEAGHYVSHFTENYQLPFGYGKVSGDEGNTAATATYDELTFSSDNWLASEVTKDEVKYSHTAANPNNKDKPITDNVTPKFGETFTIVDSHYDEMGHYFGTTSHTVKLPLPSINELTATSSSVLTGIKMDGETGEITQTNANVGTLTLAEFKPVTVASDINLSDQDKINEAFGKLELRIKTEETNRANAIDTEITDRNTAITKAINDLDVSDSEVEGQYVSAVSETDGKISVSRKTIPTYSLSTGTANGTVKFNGAEVNVAGLGSAAYTESSVYATAAQGQKADSALQLTTEFNGKTIQALLELISELQTEVNTLKEQVKSLLPEETE